MENYNILKKSVTKLGNEIELVSLVNAEDLCAQDFLKVLIIGAFHGDEPQGKILIEKYLDKYSPSPHPSHSISPISRGVLFIPCLNPDGMQLGTRTNANGVDLNRNFPTKNWGEDTSAAGDNPSDYFAGQAAGSEIETQFVIDVIEEYKPELIITLHAPYKVVNYDGPAEELAEWISEIIGYPVEASIGYPTPGSFGTYAGVERQIPTITLELDEICPVESLIEPVFEIFDEVIPR